MDEEAIKRMIAGDMPEYTTGESERVPAKEEGKSREDAPGDTQTSHGRGHPQAGTAVNEKEGSMGKPPPSRRKRTKDAYSETFLGQCRNTDHKQTSVLFGKDVYDSIRKILRIGGELTITGFVNNVLRHHFREYKEEISELRRNYIADLTKEEEEE